MMNDTDQSEPKCRRCRAAIPRPEPRVVDHDGVVCLVCLAFDNRLTDHDRRFLRALRIAVSD